MRYQFMRFPEGKAKAVTLSYDDGVIEDIRLSDRVTQAGMKCTFNINSSKYREFLSKEKIREYMLDRGHEIAVHGAWHLASGSIRPIEGITDILNCRLELEERYGMIIRGMAYPDSGINRILPGNSYENIRNYLKDLGIVYSRTAGGDNNSFALPTDWYAWMPTVHHDNSKIMEYIDEFINIDLSDKVYDAGRAPRLFFLWGHSYEFERNNNWEHLDEICDALGNHKEIWYATNIEIYEYINAYNSLVYSADGEIIYNPTVFTIYFDIDKIPYKILPGETIKI